jgi:hypothetical protein
LDWIGLDWTGLDWIGLDWIGLDWIGLDWIGLDWIGLDWIGLDWTEYIRFPALIDPMHILSAGPLCPHALQTFLSVKEPYLSPSTLLKVRMELG